MTLTEYDFCVVSIFDTAIHFQNVHCGNFVCTFSTALLETRIRGTGTLADTSKTHHTLGTEKACCLVYRSDSSLTF